MIDTCKKFLALPLQTKFLAAKVFLSLGCVRLKLMVVSLSEIHRELLIVPVSPEVSDYEKNVSVEISRLVEQVANHTLWESNCLTRAVCVSKQLLLTGIANSLHIGTRLKDGNLQAHAWISVEGEIVCGAGEASFYKEITRLQSGLLNFDNSIPKARKTL